MVANRRVEMRDRRSICSSVISVVVYTRYAFGHRPSPPDHLVARFALTTTPAHTITHQAGGDLL